MTRGKKKCEILKTIRCQVAKKNGIPYTYTECTYQGECRGTCPKCEEELRYLTRELEKLKKSGKQVAVAGVAAAVIATTAAGCSSDFLDNLGFEQQQQVPGGITVPPTVTMGEPAYSPPVEPEIQEEEPLIPGEVPEVEIMGDMAPPEEEYVTAGVPMPGVPVISDVISDLQQGNEVYMDYFERTAIQVEWEAYLTESGEDYDIFTVDGEQIIVTYQQDGWGDSVTLYAGITTEDAQ